MFITNRNRGYGRHGEQFASGKFLAVFSHNKYKAEDQVNPVIPGPVHFREIKVPGVCSCAGNPSYYQKYCPVHKDSYVVPSVDGRKLYACVRKTTLRQFGHFMMGVIRIAGQSVTVSGAYGGDGLPMDYEDLTPAARAKLVEVPADLAEQFWQGGGHNSSGAEAPDMRKWAAETFAG